MVEVVETKENSSDGLVEEIHTQLTFEDSAEYMFYMMITSRLFTSVKLALVIKDYLSGSEVTDLTI